MCIHRYILKYTHPKHNDIKPELSKCKTELLWGREVDFTTLQDIFIAAGILSI